MYAAVRLLEAHGVDPQKEHEFEFLLDPDIIGSVPPSPSTKLEESDTDSVEISDPKKSESVIERNLKHNFGLNLKSDDSEKETLNDFRGNSNWNTIWNVIRHSDLSETGGLKRDSPAELLAKSERIRSAFIHAWTGYADGALGHDGVHPVTGTVDDSWGHLGATLVDALDTLLIMDLRDQYGVALEALKQIDFTINLKASFFETTIRCLGGLLSAYQLNGDDI